MVRNYVADRPDAPGIEIYGIRFFGNDIAIVDNVVRDSSNEDGRHADCMQTYSDDTPPSQRVLIEATAASG